MSWSNPLSEPPLKLLSGLVLNRAVPDLILCCGMNSCQAKQEHDAGSEFKHWTQKWLLLLTRMVGNAISNQAYSFHLIYSKWIIWLREYNTWQYVESQMRDNKCVE